jgi:propionyl-CoA carboxylase alpha chain
MGDKLESKRTAISAGVNTIPGYDGIVKDTDEAIKLAKEIGYPVMLKASAGGGGKGMRIAWNDKEVVEGFKLASEEAKTAVNDERLLIEKFIDKPRHIEIQVLGDEHGNVIYLNERECSIQRRNQKVVEEAPSVFLDGETRQAMGEQAVALAKSVQYNSAGTVEFLVDSQRNFYFLEMNTRLQVEHPITECITGVDLVREMIKSASGHKLSLTQKDIGINGWAVEARVYAEDPTRFLPSIGYLSRYIEPTGRPGLENVRVDTGIIEGSTISMYYDPMISKLVTHGPDRESALLTMGKALDNYCIKGVTHNIPILRDIITHPRFVSGDISTNFIEEVYPKGFQGHQLNSEETEQLLASAALMYFKKLKSSRQFLNQERQLLAPSEGGPHQLVLSIDNDIYDVTIGGVDDSKYCINVNGKVMELFTDWELGDSIMTANIRGNDIIVHYEGRSGQLYTLRFYGDKYSVMVQESREAELAKDLPEKPKDYRDYLVRAPMPGIVRSISVKEGDKVESGDILLTLEAMKMQNAISAPFAGTVKHIFVKVNESVAEGDVLIEIDT